ncbi:unnamed protein product [Acanthoscelides obtectus]|uniref:Protein cornichon homolog 4 n=1 Tax=Acanthoscelides obtectus TaxID=200917 RepID=A0A9P0LZK7_ACAOB|nr:unnamed protein product [Acanthoscelides obtectus]CAK1653586.1 Protein cornichon homolog 4 [Acanthoscelides obtectus]
MFLSDGLLFSICLADTGALLFLLIYFLITLSDSECDYLNAQECCARLNVWVYPRIIAHVFVTAILLLQGHWILALFNLPMTIWLALEISNVPKSNLGVFDPTEIYNRGQLKYQMTRTMVCFGYYLIFFFTYLYCMIASLLEGDPINRKDEGEIIDRL